MEGKHPGTVDVLADKIAFAEGILKPEHLGISLMPGRRSLRTATDLVNSPAMEELLRTAKENYDMVIVDTPPMSVAPDAECVAAYADAAFGNGHGMGPADLHDPDLPAVILVYDLPRPGDNTILFYIRITHDHLKKARDSRPDK